MSVAECYDLSVQCDGEHPPGVYVRNDFTGTNKREAHVAMRKVGWKLGPNFTAYCPACVKKRGEQALVREALARGRF